MGRQKNMYVVTHADGHTTQVIAPNVHEVANAIHTFKIDAVQIQRVPNGNRNFKPKKVQRGEFPLAFCFDFGGAPTAQARRILAE